MKLQGIDEDEPPGQPAFPLEERSVPSLTYVNPGLIQT